METRICRKCGYEGPYESFPTAGVTTKSGKVLRRRLCQKCYYRHNTLKQAKKSRRWLEDYKKKCQCLHCGIADYRVLDFHHRNPEEKLFEVSTKAGNGYGPRTLLEEIKKCDVLCANCHRIVTCEKRAVSSVG